MKEMNNMAKKIIALYLPQYHEIPENNEWWGVGHTEWESCKKATPKFAGHYQPKVPLDNNYYDLSDQSAQVEQAALAKKYGVFGFCYYHYWFEGKLLLQLPAENMLKNPLINIPFCFSWANHSWVNKIDKNGKKELITQTYGKEDDWIKHFNYLLSFFTDDRYIKINNKPVFIIYDTYTISCWESMRNIWIEMAKKAGFSGMYFVNTLKHERDIELSNKYNFDAQFEYQPTFSVAKRNRIDFTWYYYYKRVFMKDIIGKPSYYSYDKIWSRALTLTPNNNITTYLGAFVDWDITARWGDKGLAYKGATPLKFKKYLKQQIQRSKTMVDSEFIFVTAWNEWSEGAYLEPDTKHEFSYLEAVQEALQETEELDIDSSKKIKNLS
jgi:hypothetical protein